jgi:hypothetical protein
MTLRILNRFDLDIYWYFSGVSIGFNIYKHGLQLSLIFLDIGLYYSDPKKRKALKFLESEFE